MEQLKMASKTAQAKAKTLKAEKLARNKKEIADITASLKNLSGTERKSAAQRLNRLKVAVKKKQYTFKEVINGVEYETKVTPKQFAAMQKAKKDAEKLDKQRTSLRNGYTALSEKEKKKAGKEIQKLSRQSAAKKKTILKVVHNRTHKASTTNKFGVKTTISTELKRKSGKPKNDETYYIVFRINGDIEGNTYQYEFSEGGVYTAIEDGVKGDKDFYAIIERRFSPQIANAAEIISIKTATRSKKQVK